MKLGIRSNLRHFRLNPLAEQHATSGRKNQTNKDFHWVLNMSLKRGQMWGREADVLEMQ
jgi:hypothetical protein